MSVIALFIDTKNAFYTVTGAWLIAAIIGANWAVAQASQFEIALQPQAVEKIAKANE